MPAALAAASIWSKSAAVRPLEPITGATPCSIAVSAICLATAPEVNSTSTSTASRASSTSAKTGDAEGVAAESGPEVLAGATPRDGARKGDSVGREGAFGDRAAGPAGRAGDAEIDVSHR